MLLKWLVDAPLGDALTCTPAPRERGAKGNVIYG